MRFKLLLHPLFQLLVVTVLVISVIYTTPLATGINGNNIIEVRIDRIVIIERPPGSSTFENEIRISSSISNHHPVAKKVFSPDFPVELEYNSQNPTINVNHTIDDNSSFYRIIEPGLLNLEIITVLSYNIPQLGGGLPNGEYEFKISLCLTRSESGLICNKDIPSLPIRFNYTSQSEVVNPNRPSDWKERRYPILTHHIILLFYTAFFTNRVQKYRVMTKPTSELYPSKDI